MALSAVYWDTCQSFSARVINVTVRHEKALDFSGRKVPPGKPAWLSVSRRDSRH